jgi:hypothetical protein
MSPSNDGRELKRIYFAHPITDYGSPRQAEAIAFLSLTWQVVNPDTPEHQAGYAAEGMAYFEALAGSCDLLAFMRFPDGSIGAGVGKEIEAAQKAGVRWVLEYFQGQTYPVHGLPTPILSVSQTRERIIQLKGSTLRVLSKAEGRQP